MKSTLLRQCARSCREIVRPAAALGAALLLFLGARPAFAQPPVIDGNLDDMITYAQNLNSSHTGFGLYITDKPDASGNPTEETIYNDLKFIPCPTPQPALGTHWINGVEIFHHVFAYTPGSTTLYLGIRSEGMIGDSDGNNNPDTSGGGSCNPDDNVKDGPGISGNELYAWNFDLDCDGVSDGRIEIQDNAILATGTMAGATGTIAFRQNGATGATGHDLEVQVNLPHPLPGAFNFVNVEANAFDGLSEDRSAGAPLIGNAAIDVSKSVSNPSVCPNQTTRFTITINNTGQTQLSVVAKDQLPVALTFAGNVQSSCGVGAPTVANGLVTFPAFNLDAGASCTISYDATASAQCFGEVSNTVNVTGTFTSACIEKGGKQTVKDSATATVTCKAPASVDVTAQGPASACANGPVTISGTVQNTSQTAGNIVVSVNGQQAFSQSVNAGATANWTINLNMPASCTAGQNVPFTVHATATGDCGDATDDATVNVRCASPPCLTLKVNRDLSSACPGDSITFTGTASSCSPDSQFVTIAVNGVVLRSSQMTGNGTYNFSFKQAMSQCTAGNAVTFNVLATATNACGTPATQTTPLTVQCNTPPTVSVTAQANKQSGCPNEAVTISGTVTNTGAQAGNFTVTVGGQQAFSGSIAAGQSANWTFNGTLGNCTAGQSVSFAVVASVSNSCGNAQDTKTVTVQCNPAPCVVLTANGAPPTACPGDAITVSGTVQNCSTAAETITVTVNGEQVFNQSVAAGQTANWTKATTMPQCTAGNNVSWNVVATATGACPPVATDSKTVTVQCNSAPCVQLIGLGATKSVACPAESLTVFGTVKNCGAQSGTFTVTIGGVQVYNATIAANGSASFTRQVTQSACTAGANVDYAVHASVTNSCGNNTADGTVSVLCQQKPCVELTATGPKNSCSNSPITIQGTVKNCGPNTATITVKVGDTQAFSQSVPSGSTQNWNLQVPFTCTAGQNVSYVVTATVTNDCGTDTKTQTVNVLCQAPPCVAINLNAPALACVGASLQLTGTVTNCSNSTETIEVHFQQQSQVIADVAPGQSKDYSFQVRMPDCTVGNVQQWTVTALAHNDCGQAEKSAVDETKCKLPMIKVKKAAESLVNDGDVIHYTIIVENPGEAPLQNVTISDPLCSYTVYNNHANPPTTSAPAVGSNGTVTWVLPILQPGESTALTFEAKASVAAGGGTCPGDFLCRNKVTASGTCTGTTDATPVTSSDETATTIRCGGSTGECKISIDKSVNPSGAVDQGTLLHYTIVVNNPSTTTALTNVQVTDDGCSETTYEGNANPSPTSAPSTGSTGGTVTWNIASIAAGGHVTLTFDAKVKTLGSPDCESERSCSHHASVVGYCGNTQVRADDSVSTPINPCSNTVASCPRSPGFWTQQCAQKGNGSTKFTADQVTQIAAKIDDTSAFFNWGSGSFASFCAAVNPSKPMSARKQAERQFAVLVANYATGVLKLTPGNGGALFLDPNTKVSCSGFSSTTIGALMSEIDGKLISLAGGSADAKAYSDIAGCLDAINNGQGIAVTAGCDEGGDGEDDNHGDDSRVKLSAATPNPFTSTTQFSYEVTGDASNVSVIVYNVAGRQVRTLVSNTQPSGRYTITWDGKADDGTTVTRGVYFVRAVVAGQKSPVQRVLYIRGQ